MARGRPALVSALFGAPLLAAGGYLLALQSRYPLAEGVQAPPAAGGALALFGGFVVALGLYVHYVGAPEPPTLRDGEYHVDQRDPAQRNALAQATLGLPILGVGCYLLYFTEQPYLFPAVPLAGGLYLFSTGLHRYWRNTLTTYFVTNQRVMEEYRFLSLVRNEVALDQVRAVEERRSMWDSLFGLGRVYVRAGATGDLTVAANEVYDSTEFADEIRAVVGESPSGATTVVGSGRPTAGRSAVDAVDADDEPAESAESAEPTGSAGAIDPGDAADDLEDSALGDADDPAASGGRRDRSDSVPTTDGGSVLDRSTGEADADDGRSESPSGGRER